MLLTILFQNQILEEISLGNSEFNFVFHVNLIPLTFAILYIIEHLF